MDLLNQMINFNPHKRIDALHALKHPYVRKFFNPEEIMSKTHHVVPPLDDNIQLTVTEYRNRLYQIITSKKLRKYNRIKSVEQPENISSSTTHIDNKQMSELLTVRNAIPVEKSLGSSSQNKHCKEGLTTSQANSVMGIDGTSKSYSKPVHKISTNHGCHQNPHMNDWNPENTRPISDLATYAVTSNTTIPMNRPYSQIEALPTTTTAAVTEGPSRVSVHNNNESCCEHVEEFNEQTLIKPSEVIKPTTEQTTTTTTDYAISNTDYNHSIFNKESRMCISTTDYYPINGFNEKVSSDNIQRSTTPSNLRSMQNLSETVLNNLNSEMNKSINEQIYHTVNSNKTIDNDNHHNLNSPWKSHLINKMNISFRKSFSSSNLPTVKNKFDHGNSKVVQQQQQQQHNSSSHHSLNATCMGNDSLIEIKKSEISIENSEDCGNSLVKTLTSVNNRLSHLLGMNCSSSASSEWLNCSTNTTIKLKSPLHTWLNVNNSVENKNTSKFTKMDKNHKYNFSKSTNNLLNHSNTLNENSVNIGHLTLNQIQATSTTTTTTNLNKEQICKPNVESKNSENRRFASAPLLPTSLSGYVIKHRPLVPVSNNASSVSSSSSMFPSTTITHTTTILTNTTSINVSNSDKFTSKAYPFGSTSSSSVIRLHSSSDMNNLFQDYRLRRTSKSPSMDESISASYISSNSNGSNNTTANTTTTNSNNYNNNNSVLQYNYHPNHLRYDTVQSTFNDIYDHSNDFRRSPIKTRTNSVLDTVMESTNNSRINSITNDNQAIKYSGSKCISNGTYNAMNGSLKPYSILLPSTTPVYQSSKTNGSTFHITRSSNLKQPAINKTSKLDYSNKSGLETISSTKYTPVISRTRQRLIPQHVLSRLKSLKEINSGQTDYFNHLT
ncbi:unnamed protein product [Heterobilharzia americana]|nr:unnamed protein product [Heterobilharzia americana]